MIFAFSIFVAPRIKHNENLVPITEGSGYTGLVYPLSVVRRAETFFFFFEKLARQTRLDVRRL